MLAPHRQVARFFSPNVNRFSWWICMNHWRRRYAREEKRVGPEMKCKKKNKNIIWNMKSYFNAPCRCAVCVLNWGAGSEATAPTVFLRFLWQRFLFHSGTCTFARLFRKRVATHQPFWRRHWPKVVDALSKRTKTGPPERPMRLQDIGFQFDSFILYQLTLTNQMCEDHFCTENKNR